MEFEPYILSQIIDKKPLEGTKVKVGPAEVFFVNWYRYQCIFDKKLKVSGYTDIGYLIQQDDKEIMKYNSMRFQTVYLDEDSMLKLKKAKKDTPINFILPNEDFDSLLKSKKSLDFYGELHIDINKENGRKFYLLKLSDLQLHGRSSLDLEILS